jgi:DNA-binding CsgD family transcriptional regulator
MIKRNRLLATRPGEDRALLKLVHQAAIMEGACGVGTGWVLRLTRSSFRRPLLARVISLRLEREGASSTSVAVFISDPEDTHSPGHDVLRELYGLTPAEARLVRRLASGRSLREVARLHAVALSTVRSQVKGVLQKTGTRRQAELVALVTTSSISCCRS